MKASTLGRPPQRYMAVGAGASASSRASAPRAAMAWTPMLKSGEPWRTGEAGVQNGPRRL